MEFPRHLHKSGGLYVVVANQEQYDAVKAAGFTDLPEGHVERPIPVSLADALKDAEPVEVPKKKGKRSE